MKMKELLQSRLNPEVNKENIGDWLTEVALLRENKWTQFKGLRVIKKVKKEAIKAELWPDVVGLCYEEYLIGKHLFMIGEQLAWVSTIGGYFYKRGLATMQQAMNESQQLINAHRESEGMEEKAMRWGRFAGEMAMINGDYDKAEEILRKSIVAYEAKKDVNALELRGFLAEVLAKKGEKDEAVKLMEETWELYEQDDFGGNQLKEKDYYTWWVWRSGLVIKTARGLLANSRDIIDNESKRALLAKLEWVNSNLPDPDKSWGDPEMRLAEVKILKEQLS